MFQELEDRKSKSLKLKIKRKQWSKKMKIGPNVSQKLHLVGPGAMLNYYDTYKNLEMEMRKKRNPVT